MKNNYHLNTKILGILGHPIKHTFSPFIHNVAIELKKLDYIYLPFDVPPANLKSALKGINALGIKGLNVTVPHKESIFQLLNQVSEEASIVGCVNTIVNELGKLTGYNTDVMGVLETLNPYKDKINNSVVSVVGAGGAARAVIYTLVRHFNPKMIFIINRTEQRAESLKDYFQTKMNYNSFTVKELIPPDLVGIFNDSQLIINSTSVGTFPDSDDSITPLADSFTKGQLVFDLVYNPPKTKLLQLAESKGATPINGIKMLISQAEKSFELWTGEKMPVEQLRQALELYMAN